MQGCTKLFVEQLNGIAQERTMVHAFLWVAILKSKQLFLFGTTTTETISLLIFRIKSPIIGFAGLHPPT
jgi:hypothetical protein